MPRNRILIVFIPRWSVDSADSAAERNDVDTPTVIAVAHPILKRVPPFRRAEYNRRESWHTDGRRFCRRLPQIQTDNDRRFVVVACASSAVFLPMRGLALPMSGIRDVWHSHFLAVAFAGSRAVYQLPD